MPTLRFSVTRNSMTRHEIKLRTLKKKAAFLRAYRMVGWVAKAAEVSGLKPTLHRSWLHSDPLYKKAFEDAKTDALEVLEHAAHTRAVDGVEKPAGWYKGEAGGVVREYSDTLLMFLMKGIAPEKYRERYQVDVNHKTWDDMVFDIAREQGEALDDPGEEPDGSEGETVH